MEIINKKAQFDYAIVETFEAGIVLSGEEVKAIRRNSVDFSASYVNILAEEAYVINLHIGIKDEKNTRRTRKLLLHKKEIRKLKIKKESEGLTIIPTKLYNKGARIKVEIALARGKNKAAKRESAKKADIDREVERELKNY